MFPLVLAIHPTDFDETWSKRRAKKGTKQTQKLQTHICSKATNYNRPDKNVQKFEVALKKLCLNLSKQIVVDGEGAKKFVTVNVINAKSLGSAKNIAFAIANSPLVKTAIAGEDPNWGRIVMGIGKSGEIVDQKKLKIKIGNYIVAENGKISESYDEKKLKEYMEWNSIELEINLKLGSDAFKCYTCDFTHDYIDINADYRN